LLVSFPVVALVARSRRNRHGKEETAAALVEDAGARCQNGGSAQCNQPWFLDQALQIVGNLNAWSPGKAALATVKAEINGCRPFCLRIAWNGGGGHFVTVYGYSWWGINIADPWYGTSAVPYATFPSTYQGGGTWTDNYTTKS